MPSLLPFKSKKNEEKTDNSGPQTSPEGELGPPPAYTAVDTNGESSHISPSVPRQGPGAHNDVDISAAFANLSLDSDSETPEVDTCIAHLKLLFALQSMKEDVGYTDGLWNIWDSRADSDIELSSADLETLGERNEETLSEDKRKLKLSKIREKRWALFVARAVDRYESWWASLPQSMLREDDMNEEASSLYSNFVTENKKWPWVSHMLPPLDVLMVWHAHMLNPRAFLEDTLRCGLSSLWATGMPWQLVNAAIDSSFDYSVSDEAKAYWIANTNRDWDNITDSPTTKIINCPACQSSLDVSWTSCGQDETSKNPHGPGLVGNGYGDGDFSWWCTGCGLHITKKLLSAAKFTKDAQALTIKSLPMPGTILDPVSGKPKPIPDDIGRPSYPRTFSNRLIKRKLIVQLADLIKPGDSTPPDMETIRDLIQRIITDGKAFREIDGHPLVGRTRLALEARICVRKMMSRYWENFSPFALDLAGAVLRQGIFTSKMVHIDWLHSPACRETMARLITKYQRFISIMAENPGKTCVPTLDVDLAWHTHQLSPRSYYAYTTSRTAKFTDHDDKIDEDKLSTSFEWTMKTYQDKYAEVYSECTCWYCETIRASNTGTVSRILGVSNQEKAAQNFLASGRAELCPPDKSAHISAHNAVRPMSTTSSMLSRVSGYQHARQQHQLEVNYEKACKRAKKKGRTLPPRDEYYDHWGYQYYMYSPFVYPLYFTPGLYYGWDPGFVSTGSGWAACAAGSCGGGVAAGACGGAGGCGSAGAGGLTCGGGAGLAGGVPGGFGGLGGGPACGGGGGGGGCGGGGGGGC